MTRYTKLFVYHHCLTSWIITAFISRTYKKLLRGATDVGWESKATELIIEFVMVHRTLYNSHDSKYSSGASWETLSGDITKRARAGLYGCLADQRWICFNSYQWVGFETWLTVLKHKITHPSAVNCWVIYMLTIHMHLCIAFIHYSCIYFIPTFIHAFICMPTIVLYHHLRHLCNSYIHPAGIKPEYCSEKHYDG